MPNVKYLNVEGVTGECQDAEHEGCIEVIRYQVEMSTSADNRIAGAGRMVMKPVVVYARFDKAAITLWEMQSKGIWLKTVTLTEARPGDGQKVFFQFTMKNVILHRAVLKPLPAWAAVDGCPVAPGSNCMIYSFSAAAVTGTYYEQNEEGQRGASREFQRDFNRNVCG